MTETGTVITVQTLDGIRFSLPLAGPVRRSLALLIDLIVIGGIAALLGQLLRVAAFISRDAVSAILIVSSFAIWMLYGMVLEWRWRGQTLGKRVMRIRVLDSSGFKLQFSQIAVRNLLRAVDSLPAAYLVGGACMLLNRRSQRLGDIAANTIVVKQTEHSAPDLARVTGERRFNSFFETPHLAARLRQRVSPELAQIAYEALVRRDALQPGARVEVFRELAAEFRTLVAFPVETTHGLSDERYVRNAIQVILSKGHFGKSESR